MSALIAMGVVILIVLAFGQTGIDWDEMRPVLSVLLCGAALILVILRIKGIV